MVDDGDGARLEAKSVLCSEKCLLTKFKHVDFASEHVHTFPRSRGTNAGFSITNATWLSAVYQMMATSVLCWNCKYTTRQSPRSTQQEWKCANCNAVNFVNQVGIRVFMHLWSDAYQRLGEVSTFTARCRPSRFSQEQKAVTKARSLDLPGAEQLLSPL